MGKQSIVLRILCYHLFSFRKRIAGGEVYLFISSLSFVNHCIIKRWICSSIFPDTCYHLTHYWLAAVDIPVASDNPVHYADAIRYNARTPLQAFFAAVNPSGLGMTLM